MSGPSESDTLLAPPVVAVVVVHDPGPWFAETLESLVRQDYPNLNTFFLLTGGRAAADGVDIADVIRGRLPGAFVEDLGTNPGYGSSANAVLDLVDGDHGFFCLCHDDVALDPDAIRLMVEELYRSNAGIIGPKLVSWEDSHVLQNVGLDVDRFGQPASRVEPGEYDQEQLDAVTDVFAVPSACFLTRADLFRALGGFDAAMSYHGEDVDLCWRAHISGARVMVAPAARVRHREELEVRRPDLNHAMLRSRHRLRSTLTLTAGARLPLRLVELVGVTILEVVLGLFTGRLGDAWASVRALVGSVARFPTLLARRGAIAKFRNVSDAEVHDLQSRGSNRLRSFGRARDTQTYIGVEDNIRRWRERSVAPTVTWVVVILAVLIASRTFINESVPAVGEFLRFPDSPRQLWNDYLTGWNSSGLGKTAPNPSGFAVIAGGSVLWLFHMGLGLTMTVVGAIVLGGLGVWRLADLFPSNRERIVALVTYVAVPLLPGIMSTGRLSSLVAFAALPWFIHLLRRAVGIGTADPLSVSADLTDGILDLTMRERVRRTVVAGIVAAIAVALAPPVMLIFAGVTVVLGVTSLLVGAGFRTAVWFTATGSVAIAVAWLLNTPASTTWSWNDLTAIPLAGATGRGLTEVVSMDIGQADLGLLALALYIPVITGIVLSRAWRLTWAARSAGLVITFAVLAVMQDRDALPVRVPEVGLLLVPVALGLALSAACAVASFGSDVAGGTFGWRQPLGLVSIAAVVAGLFPSMLTLTDGAWFAPRTALTTLVAPQVPADPDFGDFRVLYIGDPRVVPVAPQDLGGGIAMALTGPGAPDTRSRWTPPSTQADEQLRVALRDIANGATQRGGRLLAPYGIRYIVVPIFDGANSTSDDPIAPPAGLVDALGSQLDLVERYSPPNFALFENRSALPTSALFSGPLAEAAAAETAAQLVRSDLSTATPVFGDAVVSRSGESDLAAGVVHVAVPFDDNWVLDSADAGIAARPGFTTMTAFDVPTPGPAELNYESPSSRRSALLGQALLVLLALVAASRLRAPAWLIRRRQQRATAVIEFADDDVPLPTGRGDVPVMVPLEFDDSPAPTQRSSPSLVTGGRPTQLFKADDDESRAAWVAEMFANDADQADQADDVETETGPGLFDDSGRRGARP